MCADVCVFGSFDKPAIIYFPAFGDGPTEHSIPIARKANSISNLRYRRVAPEMFVRFLNLNLDYISLSFGNTPSTISLSWLQIMPLVYIGGKQTFSTTKEAKASCSLPRSNRCHRRWPIRCTTEERRLYTVKRPSEFGDARS